MRANPLFFRRESDYMWHLYCLGDCLFIVHISTVSSTERKQYSMVDPYYVTEFHSSYETVVATQR